MDAPLAKWDQFHLTLCLSFSEAHSLSALHDQDKGHLIDYHCTELAQEDMEGRNVGVILTVIPMLMEFRKPPSPSHMEGLLCLLQREEISSHENTLWNRYWPFYNPVWINI